VVPLLDDGMRVIDIGSGAGLPGIPVKVVMPGVELVLCESRRKRAAFLGEAVRKLKLDGVRVFDARAEQWDGELFDAALVRGVGAIDALVKICRPLIKKRGELIAMKGPEVERELDGRMEAMDEEGFSFRETREYNLPGHEATFSLVILEKA
jgi:16S rRNA (guanine527-N7)-methyltransferase